MAHYRFFLFRNGEVVGQTDCPCADDSNALEVARSFPACQSVEVYTANRLVARLEHGGQTMDIRQQRTG